jgi:hypothetical protein
MKPSIAQRPIAWTVTAIVAAAVVTTAFAPDMVTGSAHDHFPLPGVLAWLWAGAGVGFVLLTEARGGALSHRASTTIAALWILDALGCVFGPVLVTGTDPTRLPLTALVAPVFAAVLTGFVCLMDATSGAAGSLRGPTGGRS